MNIKFLGYGSAFTTKNFNTNLLITENNKNLLIDCGTDIRFSLKKKGLSYKDIDSVYISHCHGDHCGGLEYLAFCSYFDSQKEKINLFVHKKVLDILWNNTLKGGLESIQFKTNTLDDYFNVYPIEDNGGFFWNETHLQVVQSVHVMNGREIIPSYGLFLRNEEKIFITTDCQFCPHQILDFYKSADKIFQDCETSPFKSGVHAHYDDLKTLDVNIKKKMTLMHVNDNCLGEHGHVLQEWYDKCIADGFNGIGEDVEI